MCRCVVLLVLSVFVLCCVSLTCSVERADDEVLYGKLFVVDGLSYFFSLSNASQALVVYKLDFEGGCSIHGEFGIEQSDHIDYVPKRVDFHPDFVYLEPDVLFAILFEDNVYFLKLDLVEKKMYQVAFFQARSFLFDILGDILYVVYVGESVANVKFIPLYGGAIDDGLQSIPCDELVFLEIIPGVGNSIVVIVSYLFEGNSYLKAYDDTYTDILEWEPNIDVNIFTAYDKNLHTLIALNDNIIYHWIYEPEIFQPRNMNYTGMLNYTFTISPTVIFQETSFFAIGLNDDQCTLFVVDYFVSQATIIDLDRVICDLNIRGQYDPSMGVYFSTPVSESIYFLDTVEYRYSSISASYTKVSSEPVFIISNGDRVKTDGFLFKSTEFRNLLLSDLVTFILVEDDIIMVDFDEQNFIFSKISTTEEWTNPVFQFEIVYIDRGDGVNIPNGQYNVIGNFTLRNSLLNLKSQGIINISGCLVSDNSTLHFDGSTISREEFEKNPISFEVISYECLIGILNVKIQTPECAEATTEFTEKNLVISFTLSQECRNEILKFIYLAIIGGIIILILIVLLVIFFTPLRKKVFPNRYRKRASKN